MTGRTGSSSARGWLDDARRARAMGSVMAVMLFLTVLAAALGLGTVSAASGLDRELAGQVTVQLLGADDATVGRTVAALRAMPGVRSVRAVSRAELAELVRPWLGDAGLDADLPMPAMIDVTLASGADADVDAVAVRLAGIAPGAHVDRSAQWLAPVRRFIVTLAWLAGGIVLLMALATSAVVLLTARAGLDTHRDTIDVLHMLGSTDVQLSRLFQRRIALDTLIGGTIGTVLAMGAIWVIGGQLGRIDSVLVGGVALGWDDWAVLALLPLLFALLATGAARVAVLRALKDIV